MRLAPIAPLLLAVATATACGEEGASRLTFPVELAASTASGLSNVYGYTVSIQRAELRIEALHFFAGEPLFAARPTRWEQLWRSVLGVGLAHAHPGHYQAGEALAELLSGKTVDLLVGAPLGEAQGVTGLYRSARLTLGQDATLGGSLRLEGTASKAGAPDLRFSGAVQLDDPIAGIAAGDANVAPPITVRLEVDLQRFVERIDFAAMTPSTAVVSITGGSQAENALSRGASSTAAYRFAWHQLAPRKEDQ